MTLGDRLISLILRPVVWLVARGMRRQQKDAHDCGMRTPLKVPLLLGAAISDVRKSMGEAFGSDEGLARGLPEISTNRQGKNLHYVVVLPGSAKGVNVSYRYWEDDQIVWAICVSSGLRFADGQLGNVRCSSDVRTIEGELGQPTRRAATAPSCEKILWETAEHGYCVEAYTRRYEDIASFGEVGEINAIEWYSRNSAPPNYGDTLF